MLSKIKLSLFGYKKLYKEVFETEAGKTVLMDLAHRYRVLRPFPIKRDIDPVWCEAQRQVILDILAQVDYDLDKLRDLQQTNQVEVTHD